ncbi:rhodanese-like domain-containing protein [Catalinimonas alkaloidigena]|nr:rhodanese-like domain-containing protein [Catalinimonas alkaloidigena]
MKTRISLLCLLIGMLSIPAVLQAQTTPLPIRTDSNEGVAVLPDYQEEDNTLSPKEFARQIADEQAVLLDVRTPEEYEEGHLEGAKLVDYKSDEFEEQVRALDPQRTYYMYCRSGVRSHKALEQMKEMGFKHLYELDGGITAWKSEGLPVK